MADYLSAAEAANRLGVSRQTLYAYVSRGLLRAHDASDPRQRRYAAEAVARLAEERRRGRRPKEVAKATLDWGLPVLEVSDHADPGRPVVLSRHRCHRTGQDRDRRGGRGLVVAVARRDGIRRHVAGDAEDHRGIDAAL